jgi:hypothetical protein
MNRQNLVEITGIKTKRAAEAITHTLSKPEKMPCKSYGIPATECKTGSKLRQVPGSVCSDCYACKGRYEMTNVAKAQDARIKSIDSPDWTLAMARLIGTDEYFRWHDSGDLQSVQHLIKIAMVCIMTPDTQHWLPTKEKGMVAEFLRNGGTIPANLTIRVSGAMIDGAPPKVPEGCVTSTVHEKQAPKGQACIAPEQDGFCKDCRACWSKDVANVSYHRH